MVWDSQGENLCSASSGGDIRTFKLTDLSATISLVIAAYQMIEDSVDMLVTQI